MYAASHPRYNDIHIMNKPLITGYYTFQDAQVGDRQDTTPSHSKLPSVLTSTLLPPFPFPPSIFPPAHAKEALELVRMQEQTAQVKHHEEYKVGVCVCRFVCVER